MVGCVLADLDSDGLTREMFMLRFGDVLAEIRSVLGSAVPRRKAAQATLDLALSFDTWRQLTRGGLSSRAAADTMVRAVFAQ
jgi:hypothetical protein